MISNKEMQQDNLKDAASPSNASKSMKIGVDLFVHLKQGSMTKYYNTGEVLGQGAFGKVWKVTHKTTGRLKQDKIV